MKSCKNLNDCATRNIKKEHFHVSTFFFVYNQLHTLLPSADLVESKSVAFGRRGRVWFLKIILLLQFPKDYHLKE